MTIHASIKVVSTETEHIFKVIVHDDLATWVMFVSFRKSLDSEVKRKQMVKKNTNKLFSKLTPVVA